jgi:hypothetical protein
MARVTRVLCLQDGLEVCIAGSERRWQIGSYSVRLDSSTGENTALISPSAALTKKRFETVEALVVALRREIELYGEPPAIQASSQSASGPSFFPRPARSRRRSAIA